MSVYHHDLECHSKSLGSYPQGQGHCGLNSSKITVCSISPELVNLLQPTIGASSMAGMFCGSLKKSFLNVFYCCPHGHGHSEGEIFGEYLLNESHNNGGYQAAPSDKSCYIYNIDMMMDTILEITNLIKLYTFCIRFSDLDPFLRSQESLKK